MTVKECLDALKEEDRRRLYYAFENSLPAHIDLPDNRYIGVNLQGCTGFKPDSEVGVWSKGIKE